MSVFVTFDLMLLLLVVEVVVVDGTALQPSHVTFGARQPCCEYFSPTLHHVI
jgi:hypothetical protein